ncbi:hypothetical protein P7D73_18220 [Enterococcus raffinosus]|uniref:hypothetical protein n=1 Tax=Enterococcus raffinosus TaxID=71452 RepID=UPI002891148B|nr:hypothetical protein [Enterococcus raffinosus]MDT2525143.1 hypothetical protein [Enterococcus raffinosus]MDT2592498.1 hypothetical protein [Enterococcus raffinosus]
MNSNDQQGTGILDKLVDKVYDTNKKFKFNNLNKGRKRKYIVLIIFLMGYLGFFIYSIITPDLTKYPTVKINEPIALGNSSDHMTVSYIKYNEDKNFLEAKLNLSSGDGSTTINANKYYFEAKTIKGDTVKTKVVKTSDNDYVVIVHNLKPKFGTVLIKTYLVSDKNSILTEQNSSIDLDNDNNDSGSESANEDNSSKNNYGLFYVNYENNVINNKLKEQTPNKMAIETANENIKYYEKKISQSKQSIKQNKEAINDSEKQMDIIDRDSKYRTSDQESKAQDDKQQLNSDIESYQKNIDSSKDDISKLKEAIKLTNQKILDIQDGKVTVGYYENKKS